MDLPTIVGVDELITGIAKPVAAPILTVRYALKNSPDASALGKAGLVLGGGAWGFVKGLVCSPGHLLEAAPALFEGAALAVPTAIYFGLRGAASCAGSLDEAIGAKKTNP